MFNFRAYDEGDAFAESSLILNTTNNLNISLIKSFRLTGEYKRQDDVWVLAIKAVKHSDAGVYVCELNTDPVVRSFHRLEGKLKHI